MIMILFILGVLFGIVFLYLGVTQYSFPSAYLGMFVFLVLGLLLMSEGLDITTGTQEVPVGSHNFIDVYTTYTTSNSTVVLLLSNAFFYLPLGLIVLTTYYALSR